VVVGRGVMGEVGQGCTRPNGACLTEVHILVTRSEIQGLPSFGPC
jgi:hypothetical protein